LGGTDDVIDGQGNPALELKEPVRQVFNIWRIQSRPLLFQRKIVPVLQNTID
jgi:hypothetical protein